MKVHIISQKTVWVRHWFRWYRVQRGGEDWRPLVIAKRNPTISEITKSLANRKPHDNTDQAD